MKRRAEAPIGEQTNHVVPLRAGGRRSSKLRVVDPLQLPPSFEAQPGVPSSRADCPDTRSSPCPFLECRHHLWLHASSERPGNPQAGKQGASTFTPSTSATCALAIADTGPQSFEAIAELLGIDPTRARQIATRGLRKLQAQGLDVEELLERL